MKIKKRMLVASIAALLFAQPCLAQFDEAPNSGGNVTQVVEPTNSNCPPNLPPGTNQGGAGADSPNAADMVPIAHFEFDGDAKDSSGNNTSVTLKNTRYVDDALYVNGIYGPEADGAAISKINVPQVNYNSFMVGIRFKPQAFGDEQEFGDTTTQGNIITFGEGSRWFSLYRTENGRLGASLNGDWNMLPDTMPVIEAGKWYEVLCGVDVAKRILLVWVDGRTVANVKLPDDFQFNVVKDGVDDKVLTFTNFGAGSVFNGLVDELAVFPEFTMPPSSSAPESGTAAESVEEIAVDMRAFGPNIPGRFDGRTTVTSADGKEYELSVFYYPNNVTNMTTVQCALNDKANTNPAMATFAKLFNGKATMQCMTYSGSGYTLDAAVKSMEQSMQNQVGDALTVVVTNDGPSGAPRLKIRYTK